MARGGGRGRGRGGSRGGSSRGGGRSGRGRGGATIRRGGGHNDNHDQIYNDVDKFHAQREKDSDKILFSDGESEGADGSASDEEEAVMDLQRGGDGDSSNEGSDGEDGDGGGGARGGGNGEDESDDNDSDEDFMDRLPEHLRRAAMHAAESSDDSDADGNGSSSAAAAAAASWGRSKRAYYDADTADIGDDADAGDELDNAADEEAAALELQRAALAELNEADFEVGGGGSAETDATAAAAADATGAAAAGGWAAAAGRDVVEVAAVARDPSKLSRRDKLRVVISESPELLPLLAELRTHAAQLAATVGPLADAVTGDLGASADGLAYLRCRRQLLLSLCMNGCLYLSLKARGQRVRDHPVMARLLRLRELAEKLGPVDAALRPQLELLSRALAEGIDLRPEGAEGAAVDDDDSDDGGGGPAAANGRGSGNGAEREDDEENEDGSSGHDSSEDDVDMLNSVAATMAVERKGRLYHHNDAALDAEEARFLADAGAITSSSKSAEGAAARCTRRSRKGVATAAMLSGAVNGGFGDYGDDDNDEEAAGGGGGSRALQAAVNRIAQRERAAAGRTRLDGGANVSPYNPCNRPPALSSGGGGDDGGGFDFLDGLPPELLEAVAGLGRSSGKKRKSHDARDEDDSDGASEDGAGEEDLFYNAVAAQKAKAKQARRDKYVPAPVIAGTLEQELEEEIARTGAKRGATYAIVKNRGLTPHKNKLNRNPRAKKREKYRKAVIRRKGQVRDVRTGEAAAYGGEATGIRSAITRSRKLGT